MAQLLVNVGKQLEGYTFRLQPRSRRWLVEQFPDDPRVASVFISVDTKQDFTHIHPNILEQVFTLLTGLEEEKLNTLDELTVFEPRTGRQIFTYQGKNV